jgi:hypothetical protein
MSIVNEPFLVNPPKKKRKHKLFAGLGSMHRPLVFGPKGGPWKRSHRSKRKLATLQNPFGESLMIAGANPKRRKRHNVKRRKHAFSGLRMFGNPTHRKRTRSHRRNPAMALGNIGRITGLNKITGNMGNIVTGGIALIATPVIARMTGFDKQPWQKYGMQTVVVLGGSALLGMFGPTRRYSGAWVIGGAAGIAAELLRQYVIPMIPGMQAFRGYDNYEPGYPAFGPGYVPLNSLSGVGSVGELGYDTLGAFPDSGSYAGDGFGAFPDAGSAYTPFTPEEGTSVY